MSRARLAVAFALVSLTACAAEDDSMGRETIGGYSLQQTADGLEIRSVPDQHPNLNRLLARLHPRLAQVGLPNITLSATRVVDRGSLGNETEWPRSEIASVTVQNRVKRGVETKTQSLDRSWRVLILRKNGVPLRGGFGFGSDSDARAFAAIVGRALGTTPQEEIATDGE